MKKTAAPSAHAEALILIREFMPEPDISRMVLTVDEWLNRDLPEPDKLLGEFLTTTSRVILNAPTGIGKTNFAMAIAGHAAACMDFLHWRAHRAARVLFIDAEMSRRLLKRRIAECIGRMGVRPEGLYFLSKEDFPAFAPLNTPTGQAIVKQVIERIGGVDIVVFDNIMSLIIGDLKDGVSWQPVLPLIHHLTQQCVGQLWIHHTGHDGSHGYGDKTKEWGMDTVMHLTEVKREDTDVSFTVEFRKARERTPETRRDFEDVTVALINDAWVGSAAAEKRGKPSPLAEKFLEALRDTFAGETTTFQGWRAVKGELWRQECVSRGLLDTDKPHSARTLFAKYRRELIAENLIACNNDLVWLR